MGREIQKMEIAKARKSFQVAAVEPAYSPLAEVSSVLHLERSLGKLTSHQLPATLVASPRCHSLVATVHLAFQGHYPLVLGPDAIWFTLLDGLGHHILSDPEASRLAWVEHQGKRQLATTTDPGGSDPSPDDWRRAVENLSCQVSEHLRPEALSSVQSPFTTTVRRLGDQNCSTECRPELF